MDAISDRIRDGLIALGYKKGDRIGLLLPNIPQFVLAFFGIVKLGGIVVAINPNYQTREINNQLVSAKVGGLFLLQSHLKLINELAKSKTVLKFIYTEENEFISITDIKTQIRSNSPPGEITSQSNCITLNNLLSLNGVKHNLAPGGGSA